MKHSRMFSKPLNEYTLEQLRHELVVHQINYSTLYGEKEACLVEIEILKEQNQMLLKLIAQERNERALSPGEEK